MPRPPAGVRHGSPRFSPRDVVRAAQQLLQQEHNRKTRMPPARGRPPPAATTSSLSAEARALLARATADLPARDGVGFGAKVSNDHSQVLSLFAGNHIPKALEPTALELEVSRVAAIAQQSEEESLSCLSGLLKSTARTLDKAEEQMEAEKEKQKELEKEMKKREPGKFRPGVRNKRKKRGKKKRGDEGDEHEDLSADGSEEDSNGSGSDSESVESFTADGTEDGGEGDSEGKEKASRKAKALLPVAQGYEDVYRELYPQPDEGEPEEEWEYDEWGDLVLVPLAAKKLGPTSDRMRRIIASTYTPSTARTRLTLTLTLTALFLLSLPPTRALACTNPTIDHRNRVHALSGGDEWPQVTQQQMVEMIRRSRFFALLKLHEEMLRTVADWFEVQQYEPFTQIAEE